MMQQVDNYIVIRELGKGSNGFVYLAHVVNKQQEYYALKFQSFTSSEEEELIKVFKDKKFQNVINTIKIFKFTQMFMTYDCIVMDFCDSGDLYQFLNKSRCNLTLPQIKDFIFQIAYGIFEIHQIGIVHRDIKPQNVMLQKAGENQYILKICDFGLSKAYSQNKNHTTQIGTPFFMAPELIDPNNQGENNYDKSVDIWAFGVLIFEFFDNQPLFQGLSLQEIFRKIATPLDNKQISKIKQKDELLCEIFIGCVKIKSQDRLQIKDVLKKLDQERFYKLQPTFVELPAPFTQQKINFSTLQSNSNQQQFQQIPAYGFKGALPAKNSQMNFSPGNFNADNKFPSQFYPPYQANFPIQNFQPMAQNQIQQIAQNQICPQRFPTNFQQGNFQSANSNFLQNKIKNDQFINFQPNNNVQFQQFNGKVQQNTFQQFTKHQQKINDKQIQNNANNIENQQDNKWSIQNEPNVQENQKKIEEFPLKQEKKQNTNDRNNNIDLNQEQQQNINFTNDQIENFKEQKQIQNDRNNNIDLNQEQQQNINFTNDQIENFKEQKQIINDRNNNIDLNQEQLQNINYTNDNIENFKEQKQIQNDRNNYIGNNQVLILNSNNSNNNIGSNQVQKEYILNTNNNIGNNQEQENQVQKLENNKTSDSPYQFDELIINDFQMNRTCISNNSHNMNMKPVKQTNYFQQPQVQIQDQIPILQAKVDGQEAQISNNLQSGVQLNQQSEITDQPDKFNIQQNQLNSNQKIDMRISNGQNSTNENGYIQNSNQQDNTRKTNDSLNVPQLQPEKEEQFQNFQNNVNEKLGEMQYREPASDDYVSSQNETDQFINDKNQQQSKDIQNNQPIDSEETVKNKTFLRAKLKDKELIKQILERLDRGKSKKDILEFLNTEIKQILFPQNIY